MAAAVAEFRDWFIDCRFSADARAFLAAGREGVCLGLVLVLLLVEAVSELLARLAIVDCLLGDEEGRNMEEAESGSVWESSLEA